MSRVPQYLLAVYIAEHRREPPVPPSAVAELLDRSTPAATEMFQRLADDGLVAYEPHEGVTLTGPGRERAESLHETYVTVSWFYRSVLDLEDHEAEAMELAGLVSPAVADGLAAALPCDAASPPDESGSTDATSPPDESASTDATSPPDESASTDAGDGST